MPFTLKGDCYTHKTSNKNYNICAEIENKYAELFSKAQEVPLTPQ